MIFYLVLLSWTPKMRQMAKVEPCVSHQPEPENVVAFDGLREYQGDGFATYTIPGDYAHGAGARA